MLKDGLEKHGLDNCENEWRHFTVKPEVYPETYFDFPVDPSSSVIWSAALIAVCPAAGVPRLRRRAARRRLRTFHELHSPKVTPAASAVPIASAPNTDAKPTAC